MSVNPLKKKNPWFHPILMGLSAVFALPLLWMLSSSLQPREQISLSKPEWSPSIYVMNLNGEAIEVSPPTIIEEDSYIIRHNGTKKLVAATEVNEGVIQVRQQKADVVYTTEESVEILQEVTKGEVQVFEWRVEGYGSKKRNWWCVPAGHVQKRFRPVIENYSEAIRSMSAGEGDRELSMTEWMVNSRLPHHHENASDKSVTFLTYLVNTLLVAFLNVIGTLLSGCLAAYSLARLKWRGNRLLFALTLGTMMIPFPVMMVPLFNLFRDLGWVGTLMPLWVPAFFGNAFNIFLLRQFFLTLPEELSEAARLDGCNEWDILWKVVVPLSKPALSVVALLTFLFHWNDFLAPRIFLTRPETFTMSLGLQQYQTQMGGSEWHLLMACSVLLLLPIVLLFFAAQKTFIQGIATTGGKG